MMPRYVMHLVHSVDDGLWHLKYDEQSVASFRTREEAEHAGEARGRKVVDEGGVAELVIHDEDGAIEHQRAYGYDRPERRN
jgi:hypothetical protein